MTGLFLSKKMARLVGFASSEAKTESPTKKRPLEALNIVARLVGFEPTNDGTKTRCLTTWRQPNLHTFYHNNIKTATYL